MEKNVPVQKETSSSVAPDRSVEVHRGTKRATYDPADIYNIVDSGMVAHVGTVRDGSPVVIPMFYVRDGDHLLLHGAPATGAVRRGKGSEVCVTITLIDGLILARSAFHHSMNYRSVVVIGTPEIIDGEAGKERALEAFVERLIPGRQADLRPTTPKETLGTSVLRLSLANASAKARTGPAVDDEEDYELDIWAGVVPITTSFDAPEPDPRLREGVPMPQTVADFVAART